ncbi:MAG: starch synthase [Flavobacteriales bacterium]
MKKGIAVMEKKRILYVSHQINPYFTGSTIAEVSRKLPQYMNENGKEVRIFTPRFGCVNERRHQLHEVIRLSGMNLIINDMDQPLIIKVASIPQARMQVYFIDNEEYFKRKFVFADGKNKFYKDNDERALFFCRGVLETVKKLGWAPDVIHCHGWMASFLPLYLKHFYADDPIFANSKVVLSVYDDAFDGVLNAKMADKMKMDGIPEEEAALFAKPSHNTIIQNGVNYADAVMQGSEELPQETIDLLSGHSNSIIGYKEGTELAEACNAVYEELIEETTVA